MDWLTPGDLWSTYGRGLSPAVAVGCPTWPTYPTYYRRKGVIGGVGLHPATLCRFKTQVGLGQVGHKPPRPRAAASCQPWLRRPVTHRPGRDGQYQAAKTLLGLGGNTPLVSLGAPVAIAGAPRPTPRALVGTGPNRDGFAPSCWAGLGRGHD